MGIETLYGVVGPYDTWNWWRAFELQGDRVELPFDQDQDWEKVIPGANKSNRNWQWDYGGAVYLNEDPRNFHLVEIHPSAKSLPSILVLLWPPARIVLTLAASGVRFVSDLTLSYNKELECCFVIPHSLSAPFEAVFPEVSRSALLPQCESMTSYDERADNWSPRRFQLGRHKIHMQAGWGIPPDSDEKVRWIHFAPDRSGLLAKLAWREMPEELISTINERLTSIGALPLLGESATGQRGESLA